MPGATQSPTYENLPGGGKFSFLLEIAKVRSGETSFDVGRCVASLEKAIETNGERVSFGIPTEKALDKRIHGSNYRTSFSFPVTSSSMQALRTMLVVHAFARSSTDKKYGQSYYEFSVDHHPLLFRSIKPLARALV